MRVDLTKWLFIGPQIQQKQFFESAQEFGIIEFVQGKLKRVAEATASQTQLINALQLLRHLPRTQSHFVHEPPLKIAELIIQSHETLERSETKLLELSKELVHLSILGQFSLKELKAIEASTELKPQFLYTALLNPTVTERFFELGLREGVRYYLWFALAGEPLPSGYHPMVVNNDPESIQAAIIEQQLLKKTAEHNLEQGKGSELELKKELTELLDQSACELALHTSRSHLDEKLFVTEGWVATSQKERLESLLESMQVLAFATEAGEGEVIPTHLENRALGQIGQELIDIYDVPSSEDADPSLWVLGFFSLFFAMIIGDGGYGLLFLLAALYAHYKYQKLTGLALRMKRLALILSTACVLWGFLANSFFGISFSPDHSLRRYSAIHQLSLAKIRYHWSMRDSTYKACIANYPQLVNMRADRPQLILEQGYHSTPQGPDYGLANEMSDALLREFALFIGVVHLILSLLRYIRRNWSAAGWVFFLIGGWLYFPSLVQAVTFVNYLFWVSPELCASRGLELLYAGFTLSVAAAVFQHGWMGLLEMMTIIQVFSDSMSYLRLYALGLAGGIMASTINQMGDSLGFVLGSLIILLGHLTNVVLSIMSGVIHGLRLNFLEWYHYSFSGGGRWHRPLKKIEWNKTTET